MYIYAEGGLKTRCLCEYMSTTHNYFKKKQSHSVRLRLYLVL